MFPGGRSAPISHVNKSRHSPGARVPVASRSRTATASWRAHTPSSVTRRAGRGRTREPGRRRTTARRRLHGGSAVGHERKLRPERARGARAPRGVAARHPGAARDASLSRCRRAIGCGPRRVRPLAQCPGHCRRHRRLVGSPVRVARVALELLRASRSWRILLKNVVVLPKALYATRLVRAFDAGHIHAHWASVPASMAFVVSRLTGIPWSVTAHRFDIAEDNVLRVKMQSARFARVISSRGRREVLQDHRRAGPVESDRAPHGHASPTGPARSPARRRPAAGRGVRGESGRDQGPSLPR